MRLVPLESLPAELRDLYSLLNGLQSLPYEIQSMIVQTIDGDHELLRVLKRLSKMTKQAVLPLLHRVLSLPGPDKEDADFYGLMDIIPTTASHCRVLDVHLAFLLSKFPIIKWSTLVPHLMRQMPRLQALFLVVTPEPGSLPLLELGLKLSLPILHIVANSTDVDHGQLHELFGPKAETRKAKKLLTQTPVDRFIYVEDVSSSILEIACEASAYEPGPHRLPTSELQLTRSKGPWNPETWPDRLHSLILDRCEALGVADVLRILRARGRSLQHLAIHLHSSEAQTVSQQSDTSLPINLKYLKVMSFEIKNDDEWGRADLTRLTDAFYRTISTPSLEMLGLGDLPALIASTTISGMIERLGRGREEWLDVRTRPIEMLDEEDEEADIQNPSSLLNLFISNKAQVMSSKDYEEEFYGQTL